MIDLKEIHALYRQGFAIHWLRPNSKVPKNPGWTSGPRAEWDALKAEYRKNFNVGVRLGSASKLEGGYLAVIDVDIKSSNPKHREEAYRKLFEVFPQVKKSVCVLSGRGNGSAHYYVTIKKPLRGDETRGKSKELVRLKMPSVPPSKREKQTLTPEELSKGIRLRAAWEVSLLSEGRQVVLPPSLHPDTGKAYRWKRSPQEASIPHLRSAQAKGTASNGDENEWVDEEPAQTPSFEPVDLESLGLRDDQVDKIVTGEGVLDRSAECFALTMALLSRGVSEDVILSVFTNPKNYLGRTAYDHAKTKRRERAAEWFRKYCLRKAKEKVSDSVFDIEVTEPGTKKKKVKEPLPEKPKLEGEEWEKKLDWGLSAKGEKQKWKLRATFKNVLLILENVAGFDFLRRNVFANEDVFQVETPWGTPPEKKRSGNSDDALAVKEWLISQYHFEASVNVIDEALNRIAAKNSYHPVKEFLESLEWDGTERVGNAFKTYLNARMPEPYLSAVSIKFFLAMIARIYEPGCKFDHLPVFEGEQGIGKSSFGRILVGDDWFLDGLPDLADKDSALNLQGIWLCEMAELSSLYRSHLEAAKAFIARQTDKVRPPYGARRVDFPRSCVFIGTTNQRDYLSDATGNRRFWPVFVRGCDFRALKRDRLQLLAEAMFLYDFDREKLYLTDKAAVQAKAIQASRRIEDESDAMEGRFLDWLKLPQSERALPDIRVVTLEDLFDNGPFATFQKNHSNRVSAGRILRKAGYRKVHTKGGNRWKAN